MYVRTLYECPMDMDESSPTRIERQRRRGGTRSAGVDTYVSRSFQTAFGREWW